VTFPHEVVMSSKHAQFECRRDRDGYHWRFVDLSSRNGSYLRVQKPLLQPGHEFLAGGHHFTFEMPLSHPAAEDPGATMLVTEGPSVLPKLTYRDPEGTARSFLVDRPHLVIGSDASTSTSALGIGHWALGIVDHFLCPNHLQLHQTPRGWMIEDLSSRNGVWLRLPGVKLDRATEFQLGEQRFYFRPLLP